MDGLIQTNKEMKYTLKKELIKNAHKTLPAGTVMDVTQEYAQWLDEMDMEKKKRRKKKR